MRARMLLWAGALLASMVLPAGRAQAELVTCTEIQALPYVVSVPGHYCLNKDLAARGDSQYAIVIAAGGVLLDCNHRQISRPYTSAARAAIHAAGKRDIEIRNCVIDAFERGIWLENVSAAKISGNTIMLADAAVRVSGYGIDIVGNTISTGRFGSNFKANDGIYVTYWDPPGQDGSGSGIRILENKIFGLEGYALFSEAQWHLLVKDNYFGSRRGVLIAETFDNEAGPLASTAIVLDNIGGRFEFIGNAPSYAVCARNYFSESIGCPVNEGNVASSD